MFQTGGQGKCCKAGCRYGALFHSRKRTQKVSKSADDCDKYSKGQLFESWWFRQSWPNLSWFSLLLPRYMLELYVIFGHGGFLGVLTAGSTLCREPDSCWANHEIPNIFFFWHPKFISTFVTARHSCLSRASWIQSTSILLISILILSCHPAGLPRLYFTIKMLCVFSRRYHACYMPRPYHHTNKLVTRRYAVFPILWLLPPSEVQIFPSSLGYQTPSVCSLLRVKLHVSHTYAYREITVVYSLCFSLYNLHLAQTLPYCMICQVPGQTEMTPQLEDRRCDNVLPARRETDMEQWWNDN